MFSVARRLVLPQLSEAGRAKYRADVPSRKTFVGAGSIFSQERDVTNTHAPTPARGGQRARDAL